VIKLEFQQCSETDTGKDQPILDATRAWKRVREKARSEKPVKPLKTNKSAKWAIRRL
jgi:hypothetical protein